MAKISCSIVLLLTISCLLVFLPDVYARMQGRVAEEDATYFRDICLGKEKVVHIRFFVQDLSVTAPNTTTFDVAKASITDTSPTRFGLVRVLDDLLTAEADAKSAVVGRLQGMNTRSDLSVLAINVNLNVYFTAGKYANSTLSLLGRNQIGLATRELPVVGGTGVFRFARGYAIQSTYSMQAGVSVLEYHIYTTCNPKSAAVHYDIDDM